MKRLVACVLLVGCGGDGADIALDDLGRELAEVGCAKQFDCCSSAEIMEQYMGITIDGRPIETEADCVDFANALLTGLGVAQWKASLEAGRIEYNADAAGDCVAALESLSCSEYNSGELPLGGDCRPYLIPKVADGGGCTNDYECTSNYCLGETNSTEGDTDGACMPLPSEVGAECEEKCGNGLACKLDRTSSKDTCQTPTADGDECDFDSDCASDYCDEATDLCAMEPPTCVGD